jgi:DNA-binding CsgD family transcriptional regulator
MGDGLLATFRSASQAIDAASRCATLSDQSGLRLHVGLHAGDVIREPGNVFGGAVNTAWRICDLSQPGEVLVSATVRDLARTSARGVLFEDHGEQSLKGIEGLVRVYRLRDGSDAVSSAPRPNVAPGGAPLTNREIEVLRLIAAGRSNREISADLVLSERTVARHIANVYTKIGAHGRADATAYAHRNGFA